MTNFDENIERRGTDSVKWDVFPPEIQPMWVADMDFRAPDPIIRALHKAVDHGVLGYPLPGKELKRSVVDRMKNLYQWEIDLDSIVVVTGLVSGFVAAANALCGPNDGYIIQPPVYMPFNSVAEMSHTNKQENPLMPRFNGNQLEYAIDWDNFDKTFHSSGHRSKMLLLCSPHNPVGKMFDKLELTRMVEKCLEEDTVIVSDEIHSELILEDTPHIPIASLSKEIEQKSITLISPSKTFNIAGLFCGFAIIPNSELREKYVKETERMTLHVSGLGYHAAQAAFSGDCDDWLKELRLYLRANRDMMLDFITQELPEASFTIPQATYLEWIGFEKYITSGRIKGDPYRWLMENARVALNGGGGFGTGGSGFARLNFGTQRASLMEGLEKIAKALR